MELRSEGVTVTTEEEQTQVRGGKWGLEAQKPRASWRSQGVDADSSHGHRPRVRIERSNQLLPAAAKEQLE